MGRFWHTSCDHFADEYTHANNDSLQEAAAMFDSYHSLSNVNELAFDDSIRLDEHDIPEPLDRWAEQDFDDLVPSWGTL